MYVAPKTDFIYIPKYTDTSSYDRAIESAKRTISKLDKALDETIEARNLAGAARDHNFAMAIINQNTVKKLALEYNIPKEKIIEIKKEEFNSLPEEIKQEVDTTTNGMKEILEG